MINCQCSRLCKILSDVEFRVVYSFLLLVWSGEKFKTAFFVPFTNLTILCGSQCYMLEI